MPHLPTDDEARAIERRWIETLDMRQPEGMKYYPGYPADKVCMVSIPQTKRWCYFCAGTRAFDQAAIAKSSPSIPTVGEILADLDVPSAPVKKCPCGGDGDAPYHEVSLLHLRWLHAAG